MRKITRSRCRRTRRRSLLALLAIGVAAAILLFPYVLILPIIVGYVIHIPFTIRSQALGGRAPRGVGRQAPAAARGAARDPPRRSRTGARCALGLRRPGSLT